MKKPTFDEWLEKYFEAPVKKVMYKSKMPGDKKEYSYFQLVDRYKKAFKND